MANEYFVNSADLTSVADAIRERAQTSDPLVFPDEFVTVISNLGGSGATLTVTTPAEGITVTVTKGELNYTKTTGADGTAVFSGLETGTWTITISDGSKTATGSVDIDADYAAELTFFAATINVTYPVGLACTATDGVTTLTAPDTSGTWACVVPNAGTWTISVSGITYTWKVEITGDGQSETVDSTKLYLYKNGIQNVVFNKYDKPDYIKFNSNNIVLDGYNGNILQIYTNDFDTTGFKTLNVKATVSNNGYDENNCSFVLGIRDTVSSDLSNDIVARVRTGKSLTSGVLSLDISTYGGEHKIFSGVWESTATITEVWFEV